MASISETAPVARKGWMEPEENKLLRAYEVEREEFIAEFLEKNDANATEAADKAFEIEGFGDALADFARKASKVMGGRASHHIDVFCDWQEDGEAFLRACAKLRLHRLNAVRLAEAA